MSILEQHHIEASDIPVLIQTGEIGLGDAAFIGRGHDPDPMRGTEARHEHLIEQEIAKSCGKTALSTELSAINPPGPGEFIVF